VHGSRMLRPSILLVGTTSYGNVKEVKVFMIVFIFCLFCQKTLTDGKVEFRFLESCTVLFSISSQA
jgi:hypothetical protein